MVPQEELKSDQPVTLPADFSEWDGGDDPAAQPPNVGNSIASAPVPAAAPSPVTKPATARVAVTPITARPAKAVPPAPVKAHAAVAEHIYQQPKPRIVDSSDSDYQDEIERSKQQKKKMMMMAIIGLLLLIIILLVYLVFRSKPQPPKQPVAPTTTTISTLPATTTISTPPPTTSTTSTPPPAIAKPAPAVPSVSAPAADAARSDTPSRVRSEMMSSQLVAPSRIPKDFKTPSGKETPPSLGFDQAGVDNLGGNGVVFNGQSRAKVKVEAPKKVNISPGVAGGLLLKKTSPVYPASAKSAHISGTVVIQAAITKDGYVKNAIVVSGPVELQQAAQDAVKSWRYKPYVLNGESVEVETTVSVPFSLGGWQMQSPSSTDQKKR